MSDEKFRLSKIEMPEMPQEVLDAFAVTMAEMEKACRALSEVVREAAPSIQKNFAEAAKPLRAPKKYECYKCGEKLTAYEVFESGWPNKIRHWCPNHIPLRSRLRLWLQERGSW